MSLAALAWRLGATALAPAVPAYLRRRARRGKEVPGRIAERYGGGAAPPPAEGAAPLLWLHAASVGETLSILPVLEALAAQPRPPRLLVTTGTVTSAELLARRLPALLAEGRVQHRFAPLDVPIWAGRFLDGWRPAAAAFVESELWPNLIAGARRRGIPLALVNGRMSARSFRRWRMARGLARHLLSGFALVLAQSEADAARLGALGAPAPRCLGNLKAAAPPLPADPAALARLRAAIGERPVFLAASTHPGEEALVAAAHRIAAARGLPGLLTVVAPRHAERGPAIAAEAAQAGLTVARRGAEAALPGPETAFYVADTMGELGLLYRLADVALVGGSLVPHGGQNPLEPARLGCPVLLGPHTWNFEEPVARLLAAGAAQRVGVAEAAGPDAAAAALAGAVAAVLSDAGGGRRAAMAEAALRVAAPEAGLADDVARALLALLPSAPARITSGAGPGDGDDGRLSVAPALALPGGGSG